MNGVWRAFRHWICVVLGLACPDHIAHDLADDALRMEIVRREARRANQRAQDALARHERRERP